LRRFWGLVIMVAIALLSATYPLRPYRPRGDAVGLAARAGVPLAATPALVEAARVADKASGEQRATPAPPLTPAAVVPHATETSAAHLRASGVPPTQVRAAPATVAATATPGPERPEMPLLITPPRRLILGQSTLGWSIYAYRFGTGPVRIAFVGGIHGGYEGNTIRLAYRAIDHFTTHPDEIPGAVSLFIVPVANPDGLARLIDHTGRFTPDELPGDTAPGRFNGNGVDLNRNWDVGWEARGYWGREVVETGSKPFSEVETRVLRDFLTEPRMVAVVFWHSAKPGVYMADCEGVFPPSESLAALYAAAAGYPLFESFTDYPVSGTASDGLACRGVPAVAVELTDHTSIDWLQNLAAMRAVLRRAGASLWP
jgi:hypothetical protein